MTRHATLRKGFDENCAALVSAMLNADLTSDHSLAGRIHTWLERGFAKMYFVTNLVRGGKSAAAKVGVQVELGDYIAAGAAGILEDAIAYVGAPPAFAGIIIAIIVLAPESISTVRAAQRDALQKA